MSKCRVIDCRYAESHTTPAHLCGKCKKFGHGQVECDFADLKNELKKYQNDQLPLGSHCQVRGCGFKWSHQSIAHHCQFCLENHSSHDCWMNQSPSQAPNNGSHGDKKEGGTSLAIKCPICRCLNNVPKTQVKAFGVTEKCSVCLDKPSQIFFPQCGHICVCQDCGQLLNENKGNDGSQHIPQFMRQKALETMSQTSGKIYVNIPGGMGSCCYIRRNDVNAPLEGFFMGYDDWGQYGIDRTQELKRFLEGYLRVNPL